MGKIRVKTIGNEEQEQAEKKQAKARAEAKKLQAQKEAGVTEATKETAEITTPAKKKQQKTVTKETQKHSQSYLATAAQVDSSKKYALAEAVELLPKLKRAKFDETVELHITTLEKGLSGSVTLPHGTGKKARIAILNYAENPKHVEDVLKKVEAAQIDFDILIATPDTMPKLARVARVLGPRGLMPNPKNGTISPKPEEVAKKFEGGQINFKTEAKFPLIHIAVGKVSFDQKQLVENVKTIINEIKTKNIKQITLTSTMSPGIKIDLSSI